LAEMGDGKHRSSKLTVSPGRGRWRLQIRRLPRFSGDGDGRGWVSEGGLVSWSRRRKKEGEERGSGDEATPILNSSWWGWGGGRGGGASIGHHAVSGERGPWRAVGFGQRGWNGLGLRGTRSFVDTSTETYASLWC
jgi:hypothetical protein